MRSTVATWLIADDAGSESIFPQVPGRSSSRRFQEVYWRCVIVFFASCQRHTTLANYILFTNVEPPTIEGLNISSWLEKHSIRIVNLQISHRLPKRRCSSWGNQFYLLDIVKYAANTESIGTLLLFDSDCFWLGSPDLMIESVERYGVLTYALWYDENQIVNGFSRRTLTELYERFFGEQAGCTLTYSGGEIFAASGDAIQELAQECAMLWKKNLEAMHRNESWCQEEAQFLSLLYHRHRYEIGTANQFLKRIWTAPGFSGFRNTSAGDRDLLVWHLPAEKRFGFRDMFREVCDERSDFWTIPVGRGFVDHAASTFGIEQKRWNRRVRDNAVRIKDKLSTKAGI